MINNELLEVKKFAKYLGVIIDDKLSWVNHIEHVNIKLSKGIGLLAKLRHFVPENTLKNLYNAFIQPHVDYGLILWGNALDKHSHKISVNLNKAVHILQFKDRHKSAGPLFKKFKLLHLKDNVKCMQAKFMFKYVQNLHPECIQNIFEINEQSSRQSTRQNDKGNLFLPFRRTSHGQRCITYTGIKLWNNSIPLKIRDIPHLHKFLREYDIF